MAGLYDEKIVGAKERAAFARKLRENAANETGQMVSGHYVPNIMGAVQSIVGGWQEGKANEEKENLEREKAQATISAMNKMGYEAPESFLKQAQTPEQSPEFLSRAAAFLRGEDQPQTIPAQPYKQNVAQNVNPEDQQRAMLNLATINPDIGSIYMQFEKAKRDSAKEARQQQMEKIPTGFLPDENGGIKPMTMHTPQGDMPYDQFQLKIASEKGNIITPSQQQAMEMANKNYDLAKNRDEREEAKYQEEKNKPIQFSPAVQKNLDAKMENNTSIQQIDDAINAVKENPNAFGLKNYLGQNVMQRMDERGVDPRAKVANIGAVKIHDLSGAAVSATEAPRFSPFVPNATDTPEKIISNLENMKKGIQETENQRNKRLSESGYNQSQQLPQPKTSFPNIPSQDAIAAEMARRGLK